MSVQCTHEAYLGRCVHCGAQIINGRAMLSTSPDPTTDEALVERVAADQADFDGRPWFAMPRADRERYIKRVHRFIRAMEEKP